MTQNSKIKTQLATLILYLINKMQVLVLCLPAACCSINQFICKGFNLTNLTSPFLNNNAMQGCIKEWVWERRWETHQHQQKKTNQRGGVWCCKNLVLHFTPNYKLDYSAAWIFQQIKNSIWKYGPALQCAN